MALWSNDGPICPRRLPIGNLAGMSGVYYPPLQSNGWFPSNLPWAEHVTKSAGNPAAGMSRHAFSYDGGNQATYSIQVYWNDGLSAMNQLLGSQQWVAQTSLSTSGSSPTYQLSRQLPMVHPVWDWLYCFRVEMAPLGKFYKNQPEVLGNSASLSIAPNAVYDRWVMTCTFCQPKFNVITDQDLDRVFGSPRAEWMRFCELKRSPASDVLTREGGSYKYAEGPNIGNPYPQSYPQYLNKNDQTVTWKRVPLVGLISPTTGREENLIAALNSVNSVAFLNNPAGTLLFKGYRITPIESPIPSRLQYLNVLQGQASLVADVDLEFSYFDPPHSNSFYRGHNLVPLALNPSWYLATSDGGPSGARLLPQTDHRNIFTYSP